MKEAIKGFHQEGYWFLSNFHSAPTAYDGVVYPTSEHAYQAAKTLDLDEREKILKMPKAGQAKRAGEGITKSGKRRADWNPLQTMYEIVKSKFSVESMRTKLLATGDAYLEETNAWHDTYWGVCNGVGENHLGEILMMVRDELGGSVYDKIKDRLNEVDFVTYPTYDPNTPLPTQKIKIFGTYEMTYEGDNYYRFPCGCRFKIIGPPRFEGGLPLLDIRVDELPYCRATYDLLASGNTKGIFQLESKIGRTYSKSLKPDEIEHIGALGAILRPGSLRVIDENGISMTRYYCHRKNKEPIEIKKGVFISPEVPKYHPVVDRILEKTYGTLIYQETCLELVKELAGFTLQEADSLRKAMGKKLAAEMAKVKYKFLEGCKKVGIISQEQAEEVFGWIEKSNRYNFNRCFSGDTVICKLSRGKYTKKGYNYTIEHMYRIKNDIEYAKSCNQLDLYKKYKFYKNYGKGLSLNEDDRIRKNTILNITEAGVQPVYKLTLDNNASVTTSLNHKFPTTEGEKELHRLKIGDTLYFKGEYEKTDFKKYKFSDVTFEQRKYAQKGVQGYRSTTNGSFSLFVKNKEKLPNHCQLCGKKHCRLETHHKDGDRANSSLENLINLCPSCHKKEEYKAGRIKMGEKGYPSHLVKIKSIEYVGEKMTYDVEMAGPNHNLTVNEGIVASNSHAISYGIRGYKTAYIKAHTPLEFYLIWLKFAHNNQDPKAEMSQLISDGKLFDIAVEPPKFTQLKKHFTTDGDKIYFGLTDVSGVGDSTVEKARQVVKDKEELLNKKIETFTWLEFLFYIAPYIKSDSMKSIILGGALRDFSKLSRQQMLNDYEAIAQLTDKELLWLVTNAGKWDNLVDALYSLSLPKYQKPKKKADPIPVGSFGGCNTKTREAKVRSLCQLLKNPPTTTRDTPLMISSCEERLLGIAVTCSKVDSCDLSCINTSIKDILLGNNNNCMIIGVHIDEVRSLKTKKGKNIGANMCSLTVSDDSGSTGDIVCFPEEYANYGTLFSVGNMVALQIERLKNSGVMIKKVWQLFM